MFGLLNKKQKEKKADGHMREEVEKNMEITK